MVQAAAHVLGSESGASGTIGGLGVRFLVSGEQSGGRFSVVEHPLAPRALAAPMHRHANEDEYSLVLSGRIGAKLGERVVFAEPGEVIVKPCGQWHTFWNAEDEPASLLEIISPAGFEQYFAELIAAFGGGRPPQALLAEIRARYALDADANSVADLVRDYDLAFG